MHNSRHCVTFQPRPLLIVETRNKLRNNCSAGGAESGSGPQPDGNYGYIRN